MSAFAVNDAHVFWADADHNFYRVSVDGSAPPPLMLKEKIFALAADSKVLYFGGASDVGKVQDIDGAAKDWSVLGTAVGIVVTSGAVFWESKLEVGRVGLNGASRKQIKANPTAIAANASNAYWAESPEIRTENANFSGAPSTFFTETNTIQALAVDDKYVYWSVDRGGGASAVKKLAK
jgi:hypothetical protein